MECSGLTELWMGGGRRWEILSDVKPPHSKKQGSDRRGLKKEATLGGLTRVSIGPSGRASDPCIGEALKPFPMLKICLSCFSLRNLI
jgi:hypothetical protein